MLITIITILLLIWAAVVASIYSNFTVFYSNFFESENYHKAYYASISALERAELVTKQRVPWFDWDGWWIINNWVMENKWSYSNWASDQIINNNFSYLSQNSSYKPTGIYRKITSKTNRIPAEWMWDVEPMLTWNDPSDPSENSDNYNVMNHNDVQILLLYHDKSEGNPYTKTTCPWWCERSKPNKVSWQIRLPKYLESEFWKLNTTHSLVWGYDSPNNDAIVDRQIRWTYSSDPFTIYSTQSVWYNNTSVNKSEDTVIREEDINNTLNFDFSNSKSPIPGRWSSAKLTIISPIETTLETKDFKDILKDTQKWHIRFSLINLLKSESNMLYPFLEYYAEFYDGANPVSVSDKYFTINAEWSFADYKINKRIWKPTAKESVLSSFTSIFR